MAEKQRTLLDKIFRDKDGHVVLWQAPNVPIVIVAVAALLSRLSHGQLHTFSELVFFGMLFTWSWLEITSGVNYFRRALGVVVLMWLVLSRVL